MLGSKQKVDFLAQRKLQIKALEKECADLEKELKAQYGATLQAKNEEVVAQGHDFILTFKKGERNTLDSKGIREAFGDAVKPFEKCTDFVSVKAAELS